MCRVVNKFKEPYDIYIGRGSVWGNPFPIDETIGDTREVVIKKYKTHLWDTIRSGRITLQQIRDLDGKALGCFCKPKACHGDVIASAVKWAMQHN